MVLMGFNELQWDLMGFNGAEIGIFVGESTYWMHLEMGFTATFIGN